MEQHPSKREFMFIFINNHEDRGITARYGFDSAILFSRRIGGLWDTVHWESSWGKHPSLSTERIL